MAEMKENMNTDFTICRIEWGFGGAVRYSCESNKDGMIYATFRTYREAAEWCENKGYSHN